MNRTFAALSLSLSLIGGAAFAGPADTTAALNACASGYPDAEKIAAGYLAAGFEDMGAFSHGGQDIRMFRSADGKTYAATRGQAETGIRCFIVEDKLSVKKANGMAEGLAKLMPGATEMPVPKASGVDISKYIAGMYRDRMTMLVVMKGYEIPGKIKGAGLMVMTQ